jgi:putative hydrolase of the HAD superfamily
LPYFLDTILRHLGLEETAARRAAASRVAREHHRTNLWTRRADGAREVLDELRRRGYRLGVISNADGRVRDLLEQAGVAALLEFILDSSEVGVEKPDPLIFEAAASHLGLPASECAYIGDIYEIDILGARGAGLYPILIGDCPAEEPVERIGALKELLGMFTGVANKREVESRVKG